MNKVIKLKSTAPSDSDSSSVSVLFTVSVVSQSGLLTHTHTHSSPRLPLRHSAHTAWDAYLCQEQLTQNEITLSLTHKGQVAHSLNSSLSASAIYLPHVFSFTPLHILCSFFLVSLHWLLFVLFFFSLNHHTLKTCSFPL